MNKQFQNQNNKTIHTLESFEEVYNNAGEDEVSRFAMVRVDKDGCLVIMAIGLCICNPEAPISKLDGKPYPCYVFTKLTNKYSSEYNHYECFASSYAELMKNFPSKTQLKKI